MKQSGRVEWLRQLATDAYVWAYLAAGVAVLSWTASTWQLTQRLQFFAYLITGLIAAGLKVRLPGVKGTASVGFLFAFIGILNLTTGDAVVMVTASMLVQCLWRAKHPPRLIQIAWSISSITVAVYASSTLYHWAQALAPESVALGVLATAFFAATTCSLAAVIALTERQSFLAVLKQQGWLLPYYFCGASVAWFIGTMPRSIQWQVPIICLPVIYVIHRSYTRNLAQMAQERKHVEEVNELNRRTIETLAMAIEARDHETHGHLQRVEIYAIGIGKELGLKESELNAIRAASLLHDIGKLAVPEQIISKPGKLTREEFEKMKIHPIVGAEILERVAFPYPVVPIVRSHHEKWNGSGYPDGLQGEQIPIGARILAAVDCLDALASDRPYRRALPLDEAMSKVASEAGTSFDPKVVAALERSYRELEVLAKEGQSTRAPLSTDIRVHRGLAPGAGFATESTATDLVRLAQNVHPASFAAKAPASSSVSLPVSLDLTLEEAAAVVAMRLEAAVPCDAVAFFVLDGGKLNSLHVSGVHGDLMRNMVVPRREGLVGWVLENQKAIVNGDPSVEVGYPRFAIDVLRSALAVPFTSVDGTQGVVSLYRTGVEAFNYQDLSLVQSLCRRLTLPADRLRPLTDASHGLPRLATAVKGVA